MTQSLSIAYISLTGNTHSFVTKLVEYFKFQQSSLQIQLINVKDIIRDHIEFFELEHPTIAFLPTYLEGGNGVDNGDTEILTNPLGDFLAYHDNYKKCFGIVGSGNRNFNKQFCLTARQYSERFNFPVLDEFELRGSQRDVERIGQMILEKLNTI